MIILEYSAQQQFKKLLIAFYIDSNQNNLDDIINFTQTYNVSINNYVYT